MVKKIRPLLIEKYDIAQKILYQLTDLESRYILFSIIKKPKTVKEISKERKIPRSSVYKKIQKLKEYSLISEKMDFLDNNHIARYYQSLIKDVEISISKFEPVISFNKNKLAKK
jgi:predicted transcriptional regulator